jgi:hypothetical protein
VVELNRLEREGQQYVPFDFSRRTASASDKSWRREGEGSYFLPYSDMIENNSLDEIGKANQMVSVLFWV